MKDEYIKYDKSQDKCPVDGETYVSVLYGTGIVSSYMKAKNLNWRKWGNIEAYRIYKKGKANE